MAPIAAAAVQIGAHAEEAQQFINFQTSQSSQGGCDGVCINNFGTGILYHGYWYQYDHCQAWGDLIVCYYRWEFA